MLSYTEGTGAGGSFLPGSFSSAATVLDSVYLSSISSLGAGGLLRDMGRTVVSSNRTFRKVQIVGPSLAGGVVGSSTSKYDTAFIELATGNAWATAAVPAKVAYMPGLL